MLLTGEAYERLALADPEGKWELHCGRLVRKPAMTIEHNRVARRLGRRLAAQLDEEEFDVVVDQGRVQRVEESYYIPDVFVVPMRLVQGLLARPGTIEAYGEPLPLVVEVWSPSTGSYDIDDKLPEYQRRGDAEIWRIHPYERIVIAWLKQPDQTYRQTRYRGGVVQLHGLPNVSIDLDTLWD